MSWKQTEEARKGKGFVKFEGDGDKHTLLILTEPTVTRKLGYRQQPVTRYYFGVVEDGEVKILDAAGNTCDAIAKATDRKCPAKVEITRCGAPNDPKTTYSVEKVKGTKADAALVADPKIKSAIVDAMSDTVPTPNRIADPQTGEVWTDPADDDTIPF